MHIVYLSLGSNIGDREQSLRAAVGALGAAGVRVLRESSLYETEPQGLRDQPWFLNQVVEAETGLLPKQLIARVLKVEQELGRRRTKPGGPRTIDIDVLLYGNAVVSTAGLDLPHPRMTERRFVLEPLAELAPDLRHPVTRRKITEMLADVAGQVVRRIVVGR